ncbi:hypothetical protein GC176_03210 [bacterium]|nr:hypothetical protein [bacterium]
MIELPLLFLGGLLGSGHCVGMCGAFAVAIGWDASRPTVNLLRQSVYSLGRCSTYSFLGAVAGFSGQWMQQRLGALTSVQAVLSLIAATVLIGMGLVTSGLLPSSDRWLQKLAACPAVGQFRSLLKSRRLANVFVAGLATGFLPCGLIYGVLALALTSGSLLLGAAMMAAFGLGTIPLMVVVGLSGSTLSLPLRQRLLRVAAVCLVGAGVLTGARGLADLTSPSDSEPPACPFCADESPAH